MSSSLAEMLNGQAKAAVTQASGQLECLATAAEQLKQPKIAEQLCDIRQAMAADTFSIIVLGRFKTGKSTFLNALLGRVTKPVAELGGGNHNGPLPTDLLPCTAVLTRINYDESPKVVAWRVDDKPEPWTLQRYITEASVRKDAEENRRFFGQIREFELSYPAELVQAGVTLLDSPGIDDEPQRDAITQAALKKCDAAIVVYRSDPFAGMSEREFVLDMMAEGVTRFFTVVNLWDGRETDEHFRYFVWDRLVNEMLGGEEYRGQDFADKDIYFVDCGKAAEGATRGDREAVRVSGLGLLEQRLGEFLERDRLQVRLNRWVAAGDKYGGDLENVAKALLASLQTEQQQFAASYEAVQPQLQAIHRRRDHLQTIFARYLKEAQVEARASFDQLIERMPGVLEAEMMTRPLESLNGSDPEQESFWNRMKTPFKQKQIAKDASALGQKIVQEQLKAWQKSDLPPRLQPVLQRMGEEIEAEVAAIEQTFTELTFELTGWKPETGETEVGPSLAQRAGWVTAGLLSGNIDMALFGGALGWQGVAVGISAEIAALIVLVAIGAAPIAIPAALIAGAVATLGFGAARSDKTVDKIKGKVSDAMIEGDAENDVPGLREQLAGARPQVDAAVGKEFERLQTNVTKEVDAAIVAREETLQGLLEANQRGIDEREALAAQTQAALAQIAACRQALRDSLAAKL
jgi:hypothetical protein